MDLFISLVKKELALSKDGLKLEEAVSRVSEYTGYVPPLQYNTLSHLVEELLTRKEFQLEGGCQLPESFHIRSDNFTSDYRSHLAKAFDAEQVEEQAVRQSLLNCSWSCSETVFLRVCGFSELEQAQISSESFRILTIIAKYSHQGGIRQSYLAKLASVDPHTLHHHIRVLRNMRLITRKREIRNSGDNNKPMRTYKICLNSFRFKSNGSLGDDSECHGVKQETLKYSQSTTLKSNDSADLNTSDTEVVFDYTTHLRNILETLFEKDGYTMALNSLKEEFLKELEETFSESKEYSMRGKALRYWRNAINKLEERNMIERFILNANDEEISEEVEYVRLKMFEATNDRSLRSEERSVLQHRLLWERTLEFQVLALIVESGEKGISQRELLGRLGCKASRKVISSVCRGLLTNLGFKAKSLQEGKQAVHYYVSPEHFRYLDLNNANFVEMKRFYENSHLCSRTQQVTNLQNELRTKNLLEHIREEKVLNLSDLGHFLATWEGASFSRVDKKTVRRLVQRLEEAGLVKTMSVDMPHILERESPQQIRLVTLPELGENSSEIEEFLRQWSSSAGWKMFTSTTKEETGSATNTTKNIVTLSSRHQTNTPTDGQESSKIFLGLGKMLHGRRLHLHLFRYFLKNRPSFNDSPGTMQLDVVIKTMKTEDFLELFGDSSCMHWVPSDARHFPISALPENIAAKLFRSRPINRKLSLLVDLLERLLLLSKLPNFRCILSTEILVCGWDDTTTKFTFRDIADVDKFWFYLQSNCLLFSSKKRRMLGHHKTYEGEDETQKLCLHNLFPEAYNRKQWCDKIWKLPKNSRSELSASVKAQLLAIQGNITHESLCELSEYFQLDICEIFTEAIRESNRSKERINPIRKDSLHDNSHSPQSMSEENFCLERKDEEIDSFARRKRKSSSDWPNAKLSKRAFSKEKVSTSQASKDSSIDGRTQRKKRSVRTSWTDNQDKELIIYVFDQKISEIEKSVEVLGKRDVYSVLHAKVRSWDAVGLNLGHNGQACKRRFLTLYRTFPYNEIISQLCQYIVESWRNNSLRKFQNRSVVESLLPLKNSVEVTPKIDPLNLSEIEDIPNSVEELMMQYDIDTLHGTRTSSLTGGKENKQEHHGHEATNVGSLAPKMVAIEELIKLVLRESEDTYVPERGMSILNRFTEEELKVALDDLRQRGTVVSQRADRHNREYSVSWKILKITSENSFGDSFQEEYSSARKSLVDKAALDKEIVIDKDSQQSGSIAAILSLASTGNFLLYPNVDKTYFETIKAKGLSKSVGSGGIGFHLKQYSDTISLSRVSSRDDIPHWNINLIPLDILEVFLSHDDCNSEERLDLPFCSFDDSEEHDTEFSISVVANYSEVKIEEIQVLVEQIHSSEENGMTMNEIMDHNPKWTKLQVHQVLQGLVHFRIVYVSFIHGDEVRFLSQRFAKRFLLPKGDEETETSSQQTIPFPWTNLAGVTDTNFLMELQYWILYVIMSHPGIEENYLWNILRESEVPLASVRTMIEWLEKDGRISKLQRLVDNMGYVTYYVPEQNCMGSIAQ